MAEQSLIGPLISALPVVVGGVLAIAGGLFSQLFVHRLAERREIAKLRRDRIETLMRAVVAQSRWMSEHSTKMMFRNEDHDAPWPLDEARMLQELYFPELNAEMHAVYVACIQIVEFISEQRLKHMKDKEAFVEEYDPTPFNEAYKQYVSTKATLAKRCRELITVGDF